MSFVHLHVHSIFSNNDSLCRPKQLAQTAVEYGMPAVALTDHGVMSGVPDFVKSCKEHGVKPIIGLEFYVSMGPVIKVVGKSNPNIKQDSGHLTVLVKNQTGYANIVRLASKGYDNVFRGRPKIQIEDLMKHHEGLIVLTGCMFSWFNLWILRHHHIINEDRTISDPVLPTHDPYFLYYPDHYMMVDKTKNFSVVRLDDRHHYRGQFLDRITMQYRMLKDIFGDDLYVEMQDHNVKGQDHIRDFWLERFPDEKKVATNDVHYINQDDWTAQDFLTRVRMGGDEYSYIGLPLMYKDSLGKVCFTSREDMRNRQVRPPEGMIDPLLLKGLPRAFKDEYLDNTLEVAEKCNFALDNSKSLFPKISPSTRKAMEAAGTDDVITFIRHSCINSSRWPKDPERQQKYIERMDHELQVIDNTGFAEYFLVVQDIIQYSRDQGHPPGVGRGSVGGSLVAYLLKIHDAEPFNAKLPFYRFLNPMRIEAPDVDIDFPPSFRENVIQYIRDTYGAEKVCHIGTCQTNQAKGCIQDWGRLAGIEKPVCDGLNATLPDGSTFATLGDKENVHLLQAVEEVVDRRVSLPYNPVTKKPLSGMEVLRKAEGAVRAYGKHASGILVCAEPIETSIPLFRNKYEDALCSQFDMDAINWLKLCKVDILGLKQIDVINDACKDIGLDRDIIIDSYLDDPQAMELIQQARTAGLFQLSTPSFVRILRGYTRVDRPSEKHPEELRINVPAYQCRSVRDIMHLVALNRPGPKDYKDPETRMNMVEEFVARQHDEMRISYLHPQMEPILKETLGIVVYQEQLMQIARTLAGYDLGEADKLRKFCAKKATENMSETEKEATRAPFRDKFISGCLKNAVPRMTEEQATQLWEIVETFGRYGFNSCLTEGTKVCIMHPDDLIETVSIEDVHPGDMVPTFDADGFLKWTMVEKLHDNGDKPCVEVTFNDMSTVICTADHKFMTPKGMVPLREVVTRQLEVVALDSDQRWTSDGRSEQNRRLEELLRADLPDPERMVSDLSFMLEVPGLSDREPKTDTLHSQPIRSNEAGVVATGNHNVYAPGDTATTSPTACTMAHGEPGEVPGNHLEGPGGVKTEPVVCHGGLCSIATPDFGGASPDTIRIIQETARLCREVCDSSFVGRNGRTAPLPSGRWGESSPGSPVARPKTDGSRVGQEGLSDQSGNEVFPWIRPSKDDAAVAGAVSQLGETEAEWRVLSRRIVLVRPVGIRPTYDLQVADRTHRFLLANKIVTSNSHSYFYAITAVIGAYLKAHYPTAFYGASIKHEEKQAEIFRMKSEAKLLGVRMLPPRINISEAAVTWYEDDNYVDMDTGKRGGIIRQGLTDIKGVKNDDCLAILNEREANGPFVNLVEFVERMAEYTTSHNRNFIDRSTVARLSWAGVFNDIIPGDDNGKPEFACTVLCSEPLQSKYFPPEERKQARTKESEYISDPVERHENMWVRMYELGYNSGTGGLLWEAKANRRRKTEKARKDLWSVYDYYVTEELVPVEEDEELLRQTLMALYGYSQELAMLGKYEAIGTIEGAMEADITVGFGRKGDTEVQFTAIISPARTEGASRSGIPYIGFTVYDGSDECRCVYYARGRSEEDQKADIKRMRRALQPGKVVNLTGYRWVDRFRITGVSSTLKRKESKPNDSGNQSTAYQRSLDDIEGA